MSPSHTVVELDDRQEDLRDYVQPCVSALGLELTAYLAGADSVAQWQAWLGGKRTTSHDQVVRRLVATLEVITVFATYNMVAFVRPWLCQPDGGSTPADSIRTAAADDGAIKAVLQAATLWVTERETASSGAR